MIQDIQKLRQKKLFDDYNSGQDPGYMSGQDADSIPRMGEDSSTRLPTGRWDNYSDMPNAPEPSFPPGFTDDVEHGVPEEDDDSTKRIMDILGKYQPQTSQNDRFNKLLDDYTGENKPSIARTIGASALGFTQGYDKGKKFLDEPYEQQKDVFKTKSQPYYEAANLERQENINNRTLAYNTAQAVNTDAKNRTQQKHYDDLAEATRMRNVIAEAKNNQYKIVVMGTRVKAVSPDGKDVRDIGDSGKLSQAELENLKGEWGVKKAEASGAAAMNRLIASGNGLYQDPSSGKRYRTNPDSGDIEEVEGGPEGPIDKIGTPPKPTSAGTTRQDTPTQADLREQANMRKLFNTKPQYQKWFKQDQSSGKLSLKPRPTLHNWFSSDTTDQNNVAEYDALLKELYPDYKSPTEQTPTPTPTPAPRTATSGTGVNPSTIPQTAPPTTPQTQTNQPELQITPYMRQKVTAWLTEHNLPITDANIAHAIKTGRVKEAR